MKNWKDLYVFVMLDKDKEATRKSNNSGTWCQSGNVGKKYKKLIYWAILTL